jgi:hypothetical protein
VNLASRFPLYALGWAMLSASMMSIIARWVYFWVLLNEAWRKRRRSVQDARQNMVRSLVEAGRAGESAGPWESDKVE